MTDQQLDELRLLGDELRAVFTAERHAIAALDHERLLVLAEEQAARRYSARRAPTDDLEERRGAHAVRSDSRRSSCNCTPRCDGHEGRPDHARPSRAHRLRPPRQSHRDQRTRVSQSTSLLMSDLMSLLSLGSAGLAAQNNGVAVASNNAANANTEGYSRQTLRLQLRRLRRRHDRCAYALRERTARWPHPHIRR